MTNLAKTRVSRVRFFATIALATTLLGTIVAQPAQAGCGCDKAPPDAATVRPNAAWAGEEMSIFHPSLQAGRSYQITFASGTTNATSIHKAVAVNRRDLADGVYRVQLNLALPDLPLGPTAITVEGVNVKLSVDDSALTVTPAPVAITTELGSFTENNYQAAVGRDGTVYISLDLSGVTEARTVRAQALGYPMVFTVDDATFYNTQGFLMQLLDSTMPGLSSVESVNSATDSDVLSYARHEFNTFFVQHEENQAHSLDPSDPNWHLDGSPHIDHNHQILAIAADLYGGGTPAAGATPAFDLSVEIGTLFNNSLSAQKDLTFEQHAFAATFDPTAGTFGQEGVFRSNVTATAKGDSFVGGVLRGAAVSKTDSATVVGGLEQSSEIVDPMPVELPDFLTELGDVTLTGSSVLTLGPGSYHATSIDVSGEAVLDVDNTAGSVTVYVTGNLKVREKGAISPSDPETEKLAIYVLGVRTVTVEQSGYLYGTVYAPDANVTVKGEADTFGGFFGNNINVKDYAAFYHDEHLVAAVPTPAPPVDSCTDSCGGMSHSGSCYCDSLCTNYGDCCSDYNEICAPASY